MQEKFIGRRKFSDIELEDDEKIQQLIMLVSQDNRDDKEHKNRAHECTVLLNLVKVYVVHTLLAMLVTGM